MKYLAKNYTPAEKELLRLGAELINVIKAERQSGRPIPRDADKMEKEMVKLTEAVETYIGNRIKRQEDKQKEKDEERANAEAECPRCDEIRPVTVRGEIKLPKTGYTHLLVTCKVCKKEFMNTLPDGDEDFITYHTDLCNQLRKVQTDGRQLWEHIDTTEDEVLQMEQNLVDFKQARAKELEAFRKEDETEAKFQHEIEDMRDKLLLFRLELLNWNKSEPPKA